MNQHLKQTMRLQLNIRLIKEILRGAAEYNSFDLTA
jgi:hypothetical protein